MSCKNHTGSCIIILNDCVCIILLLNKAARYHVAEVLIYLAQNSAVLETVSGLKGLDPEEVGTAPHGRQLTSTRALPRPPEARQVPGTLTCGRAAHCTCWADAHPPKCHFLCVAHGDGFGGPHGTPLGLPWPREGLLAPLPGKHLITAGGVLIVGTKRIYLPSLFCVAGAPECRQLHSVPAGSSWSCRRGGQGGGCDRLPAPLGPRGTQEPRGQPFWEQGVPQISLEGPRVAFLPGKAQGEFLCISEQWRPRLRAHSWECVQGDWCFATAPGHGLQEALLSRVARVDTGLHAPGADRCGQVQCLPVQAVMPTSRGWLVGQGVGARTPLGRAGYTEEARLLHLPRPSEAQ